MRNKKKLVVAAVVALLSSACGGGGSSPDSPAAAGKSISGVAAAGAPLSGTVTVKDAKGVARSFRIGSNGSYEADVSGMTPPFILRAEGSVGGRSYTIHSAATSDDINGHINITPLTDLIIANVAHQLAADYFAGCDLASCDLSGLDTTSINAEETRLETRLTDVFKAIGIDGTIDILRQSFAPDHTGLDAALDILRVTTDPDTQTATITNLLNGTSITDDPTVTNDGAALDATGVSGAATELDAITHTLSSLAALFATKPPSASAVEALMAPGFLNSDVDGATWAAAITTNPNLVGFTFKDVAIEFLDPTHVKVYATIAINGAVMGRLMDFQLVKSGSAWLLAGDQRSLEISLRAHTVNSLTDPGKLTGMEVWVRNHDVGNDGGTIDHVVVTGPGLGGGVTYVPQDNPSDEFVVSAGAACSNAGTSDSFCVMADDAQIGSIGDNASYTVTVYDSSNNALSSYDMTLAKRPYKNSELANVPFPVISGASQQAFMMYNGGAITISATVPTSVTGVWSYLAYTDAVAGSGQIDGDKIVKNGAVSITNTFGAVGSLSHLTHLEARLAYDDEYHRGIMTTANRWK